MIRDKILIVEDEKDISGFLRSVLIGAGYEAIIACTGIEAFSMISSHCPDLILLDLGLPDIDGTLVIETVRQWSQLPIIVVSSRSNEKDKIQALDLGADDYITKPFSVAELLARVRVALRHTRAARLMAGSVKYVSGELEVDYDKHMVTVRGENCHLTNNEFSRQGSHI